MTGRLSKAVLRKGTGTVEIAMANITLKCTPPLTMANFSGVPRFSTPRSSRCSFSGGSLWGFPCSGEFHPASYRRYLGAFVASFALIVGLVNNASTAVAFVVGRPAALQSEEHPGEVGRILWRRYRLISRAL